MQSTVQRNNNPTCYIFPLGPGGRDEAPGKNDETIQTVISLFSPIHKIYIASYVLLSLHQSDIFHVHHPLNNICSPTAESRSPGGPGMRV